MNPFIEALFEALSQGGHFNDDTEDVECEVINTVIPESKEVGELEIVVYG